MSMLLVAIFCSAITCEEYQLTEAVSKPTCIRMLKEERKFLMSKPVEEAYKEYMTLFKAEHMDGEAVDWEINCIAEGK